MNNLVKPVAPALSLDDIKRLRELAGEATPGPWFVQFGDDLRYQCMTAISPINKRQGNDGQFGEDQPLIAVTFHQSYPAVNVEGDDCGDANSAFIAAANPSAITVLCDLAERALAQDARPSMLSADDVKWIVNDNAELGVMIGDQCFFLYKGHSLVYESGAHDDGRPMMFRPVFKREFGECAHPINHDDYSKIGTVSLHDSDEWREIPLVTEQAAQPVALDDERVAFEAWADSEGLLPHARAARWEGWQARALLSASSAADHSQPTEIGERLRKTIDRGVNANELRSLLGTAADECDRFYGGMMNWKATAQAKDKTIIELREQLASSAAGQVKPQDASLYPCGECGKSVKQACDHRPCGYRAAQQQANAALTQPNAAHHDNGGGNG